MSTVRLTLASVVLFLATSAAAHSLAEAPLLHYKRDIQMRGLDPEQAHKMFGKRGHKYPAGWVTPTSVPKEWTDAYNKVKAAGKIPGFAPSKPGKDGEPVYNGGQYDRKAVCSWTLDKCLDADDITEAPPNIIAVNFDDGPTPASPALYDFLEQNKIPATHFMIGSNVIDNKALANRAIAIGGQLGVHTWSHPLMTTMTDQQVLAELGWTVQAIYDVTGVVPYLWRPPQGDVDARVRAIAKFVFGLRNTLWNQDTNDWCLHANNAGTECPNETPGKDYASVEGALQQFLNTPDRSTGLIVLEHELSNASVTAFKQSYPLYAAKNWTPKTVSTALNIAWYQNSDDGQNPVPQDGILPGSSARTGNATSTTTGKPGRNSTSTTAGQATNAAVMSFSSGHGLALAGLIVSALFVS